LINEDFDVLRGLGGNSAQSQRSLVVVIVHLDGAMFMPEVHGKSDHNPDQNGEEQKPARSRQPDQHTDDDGRGDYQTGSAFQRSASGRHESIVRLRPAGPATPAPC